MAAAPKKDKKAAGGAKAGGGGAQAPGMPGDFPMDDMYKEELNLGKLTVNDIPAWAKDEVARVFGSSVKEKDKPAPPAGQETRLYFKLKRRQVIKDNNERKKLGL